MCCLLAGSLFLTSCEKPPTSANLHGTWVPDKASHSFLKVTNDCHILLLQTGDTFTAAVPDYLMKTPDHCSGQVMVGKGTWGISTKLLQTKMKLEFTEVDGQKVNWGSRSLIVEKKNGRVVMFFWPGEEGGDRFVFEHAP